MHTQEEPFAAVDVIAAKRDGAELSNEQIHWFVDAYMRSVIAEEQCAALLMAGFHNGFSMAETVALTAAYVHSGERASWRHLGRPVLDKHSTGGVGDKVSLPLTPLLAALGATVPQLSGRGLGHTGGTLDKLEAIAGFQSQRTAAQIEAQLDTDGAVIAAASAAYAPADGRIYALRDVTATVASVPLIAASIMAKKIAEGAEVLLLDVKVGTGAFMRSFEDAERLARTMTAIGADAGIRTIAYLTAMDAPLGFTAGNALEVAESLEVLAGGGPHDVAALVEVFAHDLLDAAGLHADQVPAALRDGRAMDAFRRLVRSQGGDPDAPLPTAPVVEVYRAQRGGVLQHMDALAVGRAAWMLGAGRARKEDAVDPAAGVRWFHKPGDPVAPNAPLFELHTSDPAKIPAALALLEAAVAVEDRAVAPGPLLLARVD